MNRKCNEYMDGKSIYEVFFKSICINIKFIADMSRERRVQERWVTKREFCNQV